MELYSSNKYYKLYKGNMLDMREVIEAESIDSIVTDPPYELGFMGKGWDNSGIAFQKTAWEKCYAVLKPGGYLLAFGGSRTFYRITCAIEDAGFEIRDTVMWLYGSGFPKSMNIGLAIDKKNGVESEVIGSSDVPNIKGNNYENSIEKERLIVEKKRALNCWEGWGTALKPAFEPVIVARKPFKGSCVDNVIKYGVGGVNIDECRIGNEEVITRGGNKFTNLYGDFKECEESTHNGRFPSNVIFTYDDNDFEEVCGGLPNGGKNGSISKRYKMNNQVYGEYGECNTWDAYNDNGSAARYFYCAKASARDRDEGLDTFEEQIGGGMTGTANQSLLTGSGNIRNNKRKNTHPTVKPTDLMQYLVRLVTPEGGTVLDPFNGSGSTGKAVMYENKDRNKNYKYIGIEMTEEYLPIAKARIEYVINEEEPEPETDGQLTIFDFM